MADIGVLIVREVQARLRRANGRIAVDEQAAVVDEVRQRQPARPALACPRSAGSIGARAAQRSLRPLRGRLCQLRRTGTHAKHPRLHKRSQLSQGGACAKPTAWCLGALLSGERPARRAGFRAHMRSSLSQRA